MTDKPTYAPSKKDKEANLLTPGLVGERYHMIETMSVQRWHLANDRLEWPDINNAVALAQCEDFDPDSVDPDTLKFVKFLKSHFDELESLKANYIRWVADGQLELVRRLDIHIRQSTIKQLVEAVLQDQTHITDDPDLIPIVDAIRYRASIVTDRLGSNKNAMEMTYAEFLEHHNKSYTTDSHDAVTRGPVNLHLTREMLKYYVSRLYEDPNWFPKDKIDETLNNICMMKMPLGYQYDQDENFHALFSRIRQRLKMDRQIQELKEHEAFLKTGIPNTLEAYFPEAFLQATKNREDDDSVLDPRKFR